MITENKLTISEKLNTKQIDQLYKLYQQMWWSTERTKKEIHILLNACMPFAVLQSQTQDLRRQGIRRLIMTKILSHSRLANVKYFELTCTPDMIAYYEKFGFTKHFGDVVAMRCVKRVRIR